MPKSSTNFGPPALVISPVTQRRFILGKQGLYPGRRWQGAAGVAEAIQSGAVVQIDPLNVIARSHDITLYGRVLDYRPDLLDAALYRDRLCFDWGGVVVIHPMADLPYWRVLMERRSQQYRAKTYATEYPEEIAQVYATIQEQGPMTARDFKGLGNRPHKRNTYRSANVANQALYHLWMIGKIMTHSRKGIDRRYDLTERIAPPELHYTASPEAADAYFARAIFRDTNIMTLRSFRQWWQGTIERPVAEPEATQQLQTMLAAGEIVPILLDSDSKNIRFIPAADLPLLQTLHADGIPPEWQPITTTTAEEMTFLAPLEIVSARGRAMPLFDFEYLWEVYKPAEKRRWGYYTLPILYGDRLVARFDSKLDRPTATLNLLGFWLEDHAQPDEAFGWALARGLRRFMTFIGAEKVNLSPMQPDALRGMVEDVVLNPVN